VITSQRCLVSALSNTVAQQNLTVPPARNAILFTLFADGHPIDLIWNIFYHFRIDDSSLSLLLSQCEKLTSMSENLDLWLASPYSHFLRVCDRRTLASLHDYWRLYADGKSFSKRDNESSFSAFTREFRKHFTDGGVNYSPSRSAGQFWGAAAMELSKSYEQYWRTGTVFTDSRSAESANSINPSFLYSITGKGCAVYYGTYPLAGFRIASAYASASTDVSTPRKDLTASDFLSSAKEQFTQWCDAFKVAVSQSSAENVVIRLFAGDALSFCRTLYHCHVTSCTSASLYASPWKSDEIDLDSGDYHGGAALAAPQTFNVIDTSNMVDHVGFLNLFVAALPLLSSEVASTLYTESLLVKGRDAPTGFLEHLCTGVPEFSLLFGIAPVAYLSTFSSQSNIHELLMLDIMKGSQYHQRIAWKIPYLGDSEAIRRCSEITPLPSFQPSELAKILFDLYYQMFIDEDVVLKAKTLKFESIIHHHRGAYAALLGLVKARVTTDWNLTMERLFDLLQADQKLILGSNNFQDLCGQLYVRGVYLIEAMRVGRRILIPDQWSKSRFKGWSTIPPVVCLILVIPRQKIKVLEEVDPDRLGQPMLQCDIRSPLFHNFYSSIQFVFGTVSIQGTGFKARAVLTEDKSGWQGSSSLIMSVWIPSYNLAIDPSSAFVALTVRPIPVTQRFLQGKLGSKMEIFTTELMNPDSVHVVSQRPDRPNELTSLREATPRPLAANAMQSVSVSFADNKVSSLSARWETPNIGPDDQVDLEQVSPCVMKVKTDHVSQELVFPFPIDGSRSKMRVARKSGWIEVCFCQLLSKSNMLRTVQVVTPISGLATLGGFSITKFPVLLAPGGHPIVWNIHRVQLQRQPAVNMARLRNQEHWLNPQLALSLSDRERALLSQRDSAKPWSVPGHVLVQLKDSLHHIFSGMKDPIKPERVFALDIPDAPNRKTHTLIFVNQLRIDVVASTLVADICILPFTKHSREELDPFLPGLGGTMGIRTSEEEAKVWRLLLPALVERCRTWAHQPTCHYRHTGKIPLSTGIDHKPFCDCGDGRDLGTFKDVLEWQVFAPYVTRAALSPIFAVSYLETVDGDLKAYANDFNEDYPTPTAKTGTDNQPVCSYCKTPAKSKLLLCGRCKKVAYCGQSCQKADWKLHKLICTAK
jgi:hypothetical protein